MATNAGGCRVRSAGENVNRPLGEHRGARGGRGGPSPGGSKEAKCSVLPRRPASGAHKAVRSGKIDGGDPPTDNKRGTAAAGWGPARYRAEAGGIPRL